MSNIIITADNQGYTKAVRTAVQYNELSHKQVVTTSYRYGFITSKSINTFKETIVLHSAISSYKDNSCL